MNVFIPFKNFRDCAECLDDKRLTKQILECKQIINCISNKKSNPEYKNPYLFHPVVMHYFYSENFIASYALVMCQEFEYRFSHKHTYHDYFEEHNVASLKIDSCSILYASGSKYSDTCIRETRRKRVYELFRQKLCQKWDNDKERNLKLFWTKRPVPDFYIIHQEKKK